MRNKKFAAFFNRKSYLVAAVIMVVAAFGMLGLYYAGQEREQEEQLAKERQQQVQQAKEEDAAREQAAVEKAREQAAAEAKARMKAKKKEEEETEEVSGMIEPVEDDFMDEPEVVAETSAPVQPELHFDAAADLSWPLQGNVILNYNMDQTVYFATLDQYKYNPAVILQAAVNTPVNAVASGEVVSIETSEETGLTMTVDMGDGYSARYGQLKEVPKNQGDYVDSGEILGYVSEPTKYYSVEGSNLYFQLLKDDQPVNPMEYLE
ncbi:stage II sporulation protein Q [Lachnospiraceae bacterium]|nr:stage II sporulation protein Q [Lachnospiraceae bacterium]